MSYVDPKGRGCAIALLQGTLDLLILRTLIFGPQHGQGIARAIKQQSDDTFLVDHGSLYPALQRLEARGWIRAEWGTSDNNRKARFYELTKAGRKRLVAETQQWQRLSAAIGTDPRTREGMKRHVAMARTLATRTLAKRFNAHIATRYGSPHRGRHES